MKTARGTMRMMRYTGTAVIAFAVILISCSDSADETAGESGDSLAGDSITDNSIIRDSVPADTVPVTSDSPDSAWQSFWDKFRTAVRNRDSAAIVPLMASGFDYGNEANPSVDVVFRELGYGNGGNWRVLEKTLDQGTKVYDHPISDRPSRAAIDSMPCDAPPCRYQSLAVFQQELDGTWRWSALLFPGD